MKQKNINPAQIVKVDFSGAAKALNPTVYRDNNMYFCRLGDDDIKGVVGFGKTTDQAVANWDKNLRTRLKTGNDNDEIVKIVKEVLSDKIPASADQLKEFNSQFRPYKRK